MCRSEVCLRAGNVGTPREQLGRKTGSNERRVYTAKVLGGDIKTFRWLSFEHRKRVSRFAFLFLERRKTRFLTGKLRLLLREVEIRRNAVRHLRFGDRENALRGVDVVLRDLDPLAKRKNGKIGVGDVGRDRKCHGLMRVLRRAE